MKNIILGIGIFSVLVSCAQNTEKINKKLVYSTLGVNEKSLVINSSFIYQINNIKTKISYLKLDPYSTKTASEIETIINKVSNISEKIDDYLLKELNHLIDKAEGESSFFVKDNNNGITKYKSFYEMRNIVNASIPKEMFTGKQGSDSDIRGEAFVKNILKYRNDLILAVFGEVKTSKRSYQIKEEHLKDYDTLNKYLSDQKNFNIDCILYIYELLTKPTMIEGESWNDFYFKDQTVIGAITTISSLRNDIRDAELKAMRDLMGRIDVPMMQINTVEAQVIPPKQLVKVGDDINAKIAIVAYDSTKTYRLKYRYSKTGDYIISEDGNIELKTDSPGIKYVEGKALINISGELKEKDWSFEYVVNEK